MKLKTLAEKKAYFDQVKLANFRESSRLEGITLPTTSATSLNTPKAIEQARQAVIKRINKGKAIIDKCRAGTDPYSYPNTNILKNKLDIYSQQELDTIEYLLTELAILKIEFQPSPYTFKYWCALHKQLFNDVYTWAGEIRTIDISKGNTRFCNTARIAIEAEKIFIKLKNESYLVNNDRPSFINKLSEYYSDLNVVHPFREGNGRTQRLLFEHIIINCGYEISFKKITTQQWLDANIAAYYGNDSALTSIFDLCIA